MSDIPAQANIYFSNDANNTKICDSITTFPARIFCFSSYCHYSYTGIKHLIQSLCSDMYIL